MAIGNYVLFTGNWGSGPAIPVEFSYSRYRNGADMVYRVYVEVKPLTGNHYFGYGIRVSSNIGGQTTTTTIKNASPSQWSNSLIFDSGDKTIANKTSGTTALTITLTGIDAPRGSQTYTYNLPIDPAMSDVSATNAYIGEASTITINKSNSSFTHTLQYQVGNGTATNIVVKTSASSYSWTVPTSFYSTLGANNKQMIVRINCLTYSGNTLIGSTYTNIWITAKESVCKPDVSLTVSPVTPRADLTGNADVIINNYEGINITGTATAKNSATISKYQIKNGAQTYPSRTVRVDALTDYVVKFTATDSRGFSNTISVSKSYVNYSRPTVSITTPIITTEGVATFTAKGNWFKGTFGSVYNTLDIIYCYKEEGASDFTYTTSTTLTPAGNTFSANARITGLDYTKAYVFKAWVYDKLYSAYSNEISAQAIPVFDWGKNDFQFNVRTFLKDDLYFGVKPDGDTESNQTTENRMVFKTTNSPNSHKAGIYGGNPNSIIALGAYDWDNSRFIWRYSDVNNALLLGGDTSSATDIYANGYLLQNFVIDSGTTNGWYWRKYKDGTVEMFGIFEFSGVDGNKNHYSGFYYSDPVVVNYPFTITSVITGNVTGGSTDRINFLKPVGFENNRMSYWVATNNIIGTTSISGKAYISVLGRM